MRAIDADAFKAYMRNALEQTRDVYPDKGEWAETITEQFCIDIDEQPTVIEQQWIPCSKPPETNENVFIARGNENFMSCCIGHYDLDAETWFEDRNWFAKILYDALYWCKMPTLPDTWIGEEHECMDV